MTQPRVPAGVPTGGRFAATERAEADVDLRVLFHATPVDLDAEEYLEPPSRTGREPNWEDMDESELDQVFMADTLDAARGWGSDIAGQYGEPFRVYEVEATAVEGAAGVFTAERARIRRRVFTYDPTEESQ